MSDSTIISGSIHSTDFSVPIGAEVWINSTCVLNTDHVDQVLQWQHNIPADQAQEHVIRYVMKHKNNSHVEIDSQGNITRDVFLKFLDLKFDDIDVQQISLGSSAYTHNFNGNGKDTVEKYHELAGCNGTIEIRFNTPYHTWYLEHC